MNIYIANLSDGVNDADLSDLFKEYGEVSSAKVITDRLTGKSRGFGFVEMPNEADALKAIKELNEVEFDGKDIVVNVAKPKIEKRDFKGNHRGGGNHRSGGGGFKPRRY